MKKALLFLLLPCSIFAQTLKVVAPVRFLALGDSYTIGQSVPDTANWPNQLKDSLAVRGIVTDTLGIIATTGWTTNDLLTHIINQNLDTKNFNLVSLLIGVNNQYQGQSFSLYTTQLPQLIDSAIRYAGGDTSHVFMVSIPDYAYTPFGIQSGDTQQISMQIDTYNLVGRQFADLYHIKYFNITPISRMGLANPALVTTDGLHPSALQYSMWIDLMLQTIDSGFAAPTGIHTLRVDHTDAYPNPVTDKLTVDFGNNGINRAELYDMAGQLMTMQNTTDPSLTLPLQNLVHGIYTIKVSSGSTQSIIKIAKE